MADGQPPRRRRRWIVPLVAAGVAVWVVRSRSEAVGDAWLPPLPAPAADPAPPAAAPSMNGSAPPAADGAPGPEFVIKGNANSMLFHTPSSPYFDRTKADVWFRTEEEATEAGYTKWTPRRPKG